MALAIVIPLIYPLGLHFEVSEPVDDIYKKVDNLEPGADVLISADYGPTSMPEIQPFMEAFLDHCFKKDLDVVAISLWERAPALVIEALDKVGREKYDKKYGEDFAYLGYKAGRQLVILDMGKDIKGTITEDYYNNKTKNLSIMENINSLTDFDVVVSVSAGSPGTKEWVQYAQSRYDLDLCSATTAVSAPDYYPYYQSGQLFGIAGGMKGAAEYEKAVGLPKETAKATKGMDAQNFAHLLIIVFIIIANIIYLTGEKEKR